MVAIDHKMGAMSMVFVDLLTVDNVVIIGRQTINVNE